MSAASIGGVALIGGMDPSGGAGLLRDAWTVERRAPLLEVVAVATALTRQGHGGPAEFAPVASDRLGREFEALLARPRLRAVKLGMIPDAAVEQVARLLGELAAREDAPAVVLDPVLAASDGGRLGAAPERLVELAARVDLITPNADELVALASAVRPPASEGEEDAEDAEREPLSIVAAMDVLGLSGTAILAKGERFASQLPSYGADAGAIWIRDRLRLADGNTQLFERPLVDGPDPRGTGCALATAIACELGQGRALITAVAAGIAWLDGARRKLQRGPDDRWHLSN